MGDDIMTRLLDFTPLEDADLARLMLDAANEISHLRAKLADRHTETVCTCDPSSGFVCIYHE